ncbi:hypothetical protein ACFLSW_06435, partial [Candidatus Bipolaricaulota bacterium]
SAHPAIIILISVLCLLSLSLLVTAEQTSSHLARSVILMIGDGMGAEHVKAARWSSVGPTGVLVMNQLDAILLKKKEHSD